MSLALALVLTLSMAATAMAYDGEIVGIVGEEFHEPVGAPEVIAPRNFVGTNLFSMTVTSLPRGSILTTIRDSQKTLFSNSGYTSIGVYPKFNTSAKIGICFVNRFGEYQSVGDVTTSNPSASFSIKFESGATHYVFVKNESASNVVGSVSFVGMK